MSAGTYLQVVGAICELGGLGTVALGIADTRAQFTDRPSLARRAWARVVGATARFRKRRDVTVHVGTAAVVLAAGSVRARGTVGFGPWGDKELEERIDRLRLAIENHEQFLTQLDRRLDDEEAARREADDRHEKAVEEARRGLLDLIREAASGGLRLQTAGVLLFGLGVVLGTWGNLVA